MYHLIPRNERRISAEKSSAPKLRFRQKQRSPPEAESFGGRAHVYFLRRLFALVIRGGVRVVNHFVRIGGLLLHGGDVLRLLGGEHHRRAFRRPSGRRILLREPVAEGQGGIVLTKLDGTAKGGVVIGIVNELAIPVKYIGIGEGIDDLRPFDPDEFAGALFSLDERQKDEDESV